MILKENLKSLLETKEMSASTLSRVSGVPKQTISGWLSGQMPKNLNQLKSVADALNTSVDSLCFHPNKANAEKQNNITIDDLLGDQWISGLFEVKLRRIGRKQK